MVGCIGKFYHEHYQVMLIFSFRKQQMIIVKTNSSSEGNSVIQSGIQSIRSESRSDVFTNAINDRSLRMYQSSRKYRKSNNRKEFWNGRKK